MAALLGLGVEVVVEPVVSLLVAGLCFLDLLVVAPVAALEPEVIGALAEVSVPFAVADGAVPMVEDDIGGLEAGAMGLDPDAPEADVEGAAEGFMGSPGAGCAPAPPIAPPRAVAL